MEPEDVRAGWKRRAIELRVKRPKNFGMWVNGKPVPLTGTGLNCDSCGQEIPSGSVACAVTMWRPERETPNDWELAYLEKEP